MKKVTGHFELYRQASSMRAELQAELIMNAFAFIKDSVTKKAPESGLFSQRVDYRLSMRAMEQHCRNPLLSKS